MATIEVAGHKIEIEEEENLFRLAIQTSTDEGARLVANALDNEAQKRALMGDEILLRRIIREVKGF